MSDLIAWVQASDLADQIRENDLLFPAIESLHVLAIALVVGSIMAVDLRLLGFASIRRPVRKVANAVLPLTWTAFAVAASAGALMFISNANRYLENGFLLAKLGLMALAGLNMLAFHFIVSRDIDVWDDAATPPLAARLSGAASLTIWIAVVACGRWVGFTMPSN